MTTMLYPQKLAGLSNRPDRCIRWVPLDEREPGDEAGRHERPDHAERGGNCYHSQIVEAPVPRFLLITRLLATEATLHEDPPNGSTYTTQAPSALSEPPAVNPTGSSAPRLFSFGVDTYAPMISPPNGKRNHSILTLLPIGPSYGRA